MGVKPRGIKMWGKKKVEVKKVGVKNKFGLKKKLEVKKKTVYLSAFLIPNVTMARWYSLMITNSCARVRIPLEVKVIYDLGVQVGALG